MYGEAGIYSPLAPIVALPIPSRCGVMLCDGHAVPIVMFSRQYWWDRSGQWRWGGGAGGRVRSPVTDNEIDGLDNICMAQPVDRAVKQNLSQTMTPPMTTPIHAHRNPWPPTAQPPTTNNHTAMIPHARVGNAQTEQ